VQAARDVIHRPADQLDDCERDGEDGLVGGGQGESRGCEDDELDREASW
jgi:hypothetical protein